MKGRLLGALAACLLAALAAPESRGEAMLQYFNTSWREITEKIPELAEAGYSSLWLPVPGKGSGGLSVGYDHWDPFDLGSKDQRGSVRTRYGTEAELLDLIATAHRFGIRVYLDNVMNHRAFDIPGYNADTPIDLYPGLVPEDFHLRVTEDGFYRKWDNTRSWGDAWQVMYLGLADLIDLATEPGEWNYNFGKSEGSTAKKIRFIRHPNNPEYYCYLPDGTYVGFGPGNGITPQMLQDNPATYGEYVQDYLSRAARWTLDRTKADGFRLDAVKHVPADFFGATYGGDKDTSDYGYSGQVQRQFNLTRGFSDANHRDTVFDAEAPRDDAMLFGEHLGEPPGYGWFIDSGMRLVDNILRNELNGRLGSPWAGLQGLDQPGSYGFSPGVAVMHAQSHDNDYAARRELQHALYFTRAGLGLIYTDGNHHAATLGESGGAFPRHANTSFLGQWGDNRVPNLLYIHEQFARGYQKPAYGGEDFVAYERVDKRENGSMTDADGVTMLIMLNDNYSQGKGCDCNPLVTSYPAQGGTANDAYLYNYSSYSGGFYVYASQLHTVVVPPGGYFVFSWRNPEHPAVWDNSAVEPITILDDGQPAGTLSYVRRDGPDGDPGFNPFGVPDTNANDFAYTMTVPRVTIGTNLTFLARADGSAESIRLKLDGGIDLNGVNHSGGDPRDNPPALSTDVFLGYEGMSFIHRAKEKFAAVDTARNVIGSPGAETYEATIGTAGVTVNNGSGLNSSGDTASWVFHAPAQDNQPDPPTRESSLQFSPAPESAAGQPITVWIKTGYQNQINKAFLYYTTDGTTYPEGSGGQGKDATQVVELDFHSNGNHDGTGLTDWWSGTIPALPSGTVLRYKIGVYLTTAASVFPSNADNVSLKRKMETLFRIQGFNATTISYRPHNDYGETATELEEGFHVLRARSFLKRDGRASIYNTALRTFYYDVQRPAGEITFPATNGESVGGQQYGVVVRTDPTVTEVWYHIDDADANNDDTATGVANGNGNGFELYTDSNNNGQYDTGEPFTDLNTNGVWDAAIGAAWIRAIEVTPSTAVSSSYPREWRFNYVNIPPGGQAATIQVRLRELSSVDRGRLTAWQTGDDTASHFTTLTRSVTANGPLTRLFVAFPPQDGDTIGAPYTLKVYFTKSLADGLSESQLIDQFLIAIQSSESGRTDNGVPQDRASYDILYDEGGPDYYTLAFPLPSLYNDQPDFLHGIAVTLTQPGKPVLTATRLVKAYPAPEAPYIAIVNPVSVDSDGQPFRIVLPDVPSPAPEQRQYDVRVATSLSGTNVTIAFDYAPPDYTNTLDGMVAATNAVEGSTRYWDFTWINLVPGSYTFTATVTTTNETQGSASRTTTVVFRELVAADSADADDDDDGLLDINETTAEPWPNQRLPGADPPPKANSDTWLNSDIHIHFAYGFSDPLSPDTDGDGLPDGLEVGWRSPITNDTNTATDTNGDGYPNFRGDLDPPFYNTLDNFGKVPGVNSAAEGGDRGRQVAGSATNPLNPDTDGDGLPDGVEDANRNGWVDGDGASLPVDWEPFLARQWPNDRIDPGETWLEPSPTNADSDGDGLSDGYGEDKNANGWLDGDANTNRVWETGELWLETDPLNPDTDGDGLPDGWEVGYGLSPWDDGIVGHTNRNTGAVIADAGNGPDGDLDNDGFTNSDELANGTNPRVPDTGVPPPPGQIVIGPQFPPVISGVVTNYNEFTDWTMDDLVVLDEFDGGGTNREGGDLYRGWDGFDTSRDIVAFYAHDGGDPGAGGDGMFYFRVDLHDLQAFAEDGYLDLYVVIDTGNAASGEYSLPDDIDTGTDMRWEAVVAVYSGNNGRVYLDTDHGLNSGAIGQNLLDFGVVVRNHNSANGFGQAYFNSELDAVEFSVSRQALLDAGWNGLNPNQLNYQVFTTKDGTGNNPVGPGDIGGRSDIRDTIYDDWIASDYWKDQVNIAGNKSVLKSWFSRSGANDHGKAAKLISLVSGNQAVFPGSQIQARFNNNAGAGYYRPLDAHQAYAVPLSLQLTPATATAIQWASADPASGRPWQDGPAFNQRLASLCQTGTVELLGTTFAGHVPSYFPADFNRDSRALAEAFLTDLYGVSPSATCFLPPERVVDSALLAEINSPAGLNYTYGFIDQMRHLWKWFGRSTALSDAGYRINQINGTRVFVINDQASGYRFLNRDRGLDLSLRQLLLRKAQSGTQDQVIILFSDWEDFLTTASANAYDLNVRWLASHPWTRLVTPDQIALGQVDITGDGTGDFWGAVDRGNGLSLPKVAKDYVDYATLEDYDNWYNGLGGQREGLRDKVFAVRTGQPMPAPFGQAGVSGVASQAWARVSNLDSNTLEGSLGQLARGAIQAAMFITAFHQQSPVDLSKFSTGNYINPASGYQALTAYAAFSQAQARFAALYAPAAQWATTPPTNAQTQALDVDLDGEPEYLVSNPHLFAVFEAIGGRLVAAFARDPESGRVCQMIGNPAAYSGRETEEEGDTNLQAGEVYAYRTSGFKDLFAQTGGPGVGTTQYVNDLYTVTPAATGTGWQFTSPDGNIIKTITLADTGGRLEAAYALSGGVNKLYIRHGLSPDLRALWQYGQAGLSGPTTSNGIVTVRNDTAGAVAIARLRLADAGHSNILFNAAAVDGTNAFATVNMRNQAHTQQVELESSATSFRFALELSAADCTADSDADGLDNCAETALGTDPGDADTDGDGMIDGWEALYRDPLVSQDGTPDPDNDGLTDEQESVAGTNPDDRDSALRIVSVTATGSDCVIVWASVPGRQYEVYAAPDPGAGFVLLPGGPVTAVAGTASYIDTAAATSRKIYRVKALP